MGQKGRDRMLSKAKLLGQSGEGGAIRKAGLRRRSSVEDRARVGSSEEGDTEGHSVSRKEFEKYRRKWDPRARRQGSPPKARKLLPHPCLGPPLPPADACAVSYLASLSLLLLD